MDFPNNLSQLTFCTRIIKQLESVWGKDTTDCLHINFLLYEHYSCLGWPLCFAMDPQSVVTLWKHLTPCLAGLLVFIYFFFFFIAYIFTSDLEMAIITRSLHTTEKKSNKTD